MKAAYFMKKKKKDHKYQYSVFGFSHRHVKYMLNLIIFIWLLHEEETEQVQKKPRESPFQGLSDCTRGLGFLLPQALPSSLGHCYCTARKIQRGQSSLSFQASFALLCRLTFSGISSRQCECFNLIEFSQLDDMGVLLSSVYRSRNRLRDVMCHAQGHTAAKWKD